MFFITFLKVIINKYDSNSKFIENIIEYMKDTIRRILN